MPRRSAILLIPLLLGCVLKGTHTETVAKNIELSSQYSSMQKERDTLKGQLEEAQKKIEQLESRNEELSTTNQMLVAKNREYARKSIESEQELVTFKEVKAKEREKVEFPAKVYDELLKGLKAEIEEGIARVSREGNLLSVSFSEGPLFQANTVKLQSKGERLLRKAVPALKEAGGRRIEVQGHTDDGAVPGPLRKQFANTRDLSAARAGKVLRFLENEGIDPANLTAAGYGEFHPVASNDSAEGRKKNRRIEIVVMPGAKPPKKGE